MLSAVTGVSTCVTLINGNVNLIDIGNVKVDQKAIYDVKPVLLKSSKIWNINNKVDKYVPI